MRILHIISAPAAGGAEVYVKDLAREISSKGHTVHIGFIGHAKDVGRSIEFEEEFLRELDDSGISHFFVGHDIRRKPWRGMWRVRRYVAENEVDIYHSHLTYGIVIGALVRIPRIYTHHNIKMRMNRFFFRLVSPMVDHLVGISEVCAGVLHTYANREVTTIFNAVDPEKIEKSSTVSAAKDKTLNCVAVGAICAQKNYEYLVGALALLPSFILSKIVVGIAGEGSEYDTKRLVDCIENHQLSGTVKLLGNRNDIPRLLSQSDLYLLSSAYEGLPIALLEATLSGLPCVVTDVGGCGEVIRLCENGILADPDNPGTFSDAIASIVSDAELRREYSSNALRLSPFFSISRSGSDHLDLYRRALGRSGRV